MPDFFDCDSSRNADFFPKYSWRVVLTSFSEKMTEEKSSVGVESRSDFGRILISRVTWAWKKVCDYFFFLR